MHSIDFFEQLKIKKGLDFTVEQKKAIELCNTQVLIIAVPGSGKTTTLLVKTKYLTDVLGYNSKRILMLTYSKSASINLEKKFIDIFGSDCDMPIFGTIHKIANKILSIYEKTIGIKFINVEQCKGKDSKRSILKRIYKELNSVDISDDKLEEMIGYISYAKNYMLSKDEIINLNFEKFIPNFSFIYEEYDNYKEKYNMIDFDDMLYICYIILRNKIDFLDSIRNSFDYILLDEAQDTSKLQYEIIKLIAAPKNNLFVIGDEDQNLYSWRGAYPEFMIKFKSLYPNAEIFFMEKNFRSLESITNLANTFIRNNNNRYRKNIKAVKKTYGEVAFYRCLDDSKQVEYVLNNIKNNINSMPNSTNAILYRYNMSMYYFAYKLNKEGISFKIASNKGEDLFGHWIVRDIISFLRLALDLYDINSFNNIYYKFYKYLAKAIVDRAKEIPSNKDVFERIIDVGVKKNVETALRNYREKFESILNCAPYDAIEKICTLFKYNEYMISNSLAQGYSLESINKVLYTLKFIAKDFDSIYEFLLGLENLKNVIENNSLVKTSSIILSTIHSSKGLEYDNVYLIDLIDGVFPSKESIISYNNGETKNFEEERRVFYVGLTRAKNNLYLYTIENRGPNKLNPSRFYLKAEDIWGKSINKNVFSILLFVNQEVVHERYGKGIITSINDSIGECTILFKDNRIKSFNIKDCFGKKIIVPYIA